MKLMLLLLAFVLAPVDAGAMPAEDEDGPSDAYVSANTGAARIDIPIEVPVGPGGFQPNLRLSYSSHAGDGPFGFGWSVKLGEIARTTRFGTPGFDAADQFELDGELLVYNATESRYHTFSESFARIQVSSEIWTVTYPNGRIARYGKTENARIRRDADLTPGSDDGPVYRWLLSELEDVNGNVIAFTYDRSLDVGTAYPQTISYGAGADPWRIEFIVDSAARPDPIVSFRGGVMATMSHRFKEIRVLRNGEVFRRRTLTYDEIAQETSRSRLSSTRLYGSDCPLSSDPATACSGMPAQEFQYRDASDTAGSQWVRSSLTMPVPMNYERTNSDFRGSDMGVRFGDVNGDGRPDILRAFEDPVYNANPYVEVYLNTGSGWQSTPDSGWSAALQAVSFTDSNHTGGCSMATQNVSRGIRFSRYGPGAWGDLVDLTLWKVADINGDGLVDLYASVQIGPHACQGSVVGEATTVKEVWLNTGSAGTGWERHNTLSASFPVPLEVYSYQWGGLPAQTCWFERTHEGGACGGGNAFAHWRFPSGTRLADVNGDGHLDVVSWTGSAFETFGNNYLGTLPQGVWINDPDAGGFVLDTTGYTLTLPWPLQSVASGVSASTGMRLVDLNGDGLADIVKTALADVSEMPDADAAVFGASGVWLNTGSGWCASTECTEAAKYALPEPLTKLYWSGPDAYHMLAKYQRYIVGAGVEFVELNGDGLLDLVRRDNSEGTAFAAYIQDPGRTPTVWKPASSNFVPTPEQASQFAAYLPASLSYTLYGTTTVSYPAPNGVRMLDVDGNGTHDFVSQYCCHSNWNWVDLSARTHADRVAVYDNGRGGTVSYEYLGGAEQLDAPGAGLSDLAEQHEAATAEHDAGVLRVTSSPVVTKRTLQSLDSTYEWNYRYAHSTWCPLHRSRFGFRLVETELPPSAAGVVAESHAYYYQRHGRGGRRALRKIFEGGALRHTHETDWDAFLAENAPGGGTLTGSTAGVHVGRLMRDERRNEYASGSGAVIERTLSYDDTYGYNFVDEDKLVRPSGVLRLDRVPRVADLTNWIIGLVGSETIFDAEMGGSQRNHRSYVYDARGNLTEQHEDYGVRGFPKEGTAVDKWQYDADGNLNWHEDPKQNREYYCHDGESDIQPGDGLCAAATSGNRGTLQAILDRNGDVTQFEPDPRGQPTQLTYTWSGDQDEIILDAFHRPIRAEHAPSGGTAFTVWEQLYNDNLVGTPIERRDFSDDSSYITSWRYFDGLGRESLAVREGANLSGGSLEWIGRYTLYDYAGRPIRQTYDQDCNTDSACALLTGLENPAQSITYDALGRMTQRDVPGNPGGSYTYSYSQGTSGLNTVDQVLIADPLGNHLQRLEDGDRVLTVQECADGSSGTCSSPDETHYTYESTGEITTITDPGSNVLTFSYDMRGGVRIIDHPDRGLSGIAYDLAGHVEKTTNARGQITTHTVDGLGRVTQIHRDLGLGAGSESYATIAYDDADSRQRSSVTLASGPVTTYAYDDLGFETAVHQTALGETLRLNNTNDRLGRPELLHYPDGSRVVYEYNGAYLDRVCMVAAGALDCSSATTTVLESVTYDDLGRTTLEAYTPGDLAYDYRPSDHRLNRSSFVSETQNTELDLTYGYNAMGGVTSIDDAVASVLSTYSYDQRNRLKTWVRDGATKTYDYDNIGNLIEKASGSQTFGHLAKPHAITLAADGTTYEYDADGNVSRRGPHHYTFDPDNRLTKVGTTAGGDSVISFVYDVDGDRIGEKNDTGATKRIFLRELFEWEPATKPIARVNVYAFGRRIATRTATDATLRTNTPPAGYGLWRLPLPPPPAAALLLALAVIATLVWLGALATLWARPMRVLTSYTLAITIVLLPGAGRSGDPGGTTYQTRWYLSDHLGTGLLILQGTGDVVARRVFSPFGGVVSEDPDPATEATEALFTGQGIEETTGLYDFEARWYDPEAGRFISVDPVVADALDPQMLNAYGYVRNDPLNRIDPTGETPVGGDPELTVTGLGEDAGFVAYPGQGSSLGEAAAAFESDIVTDFLLSEAEGESIVTEAFRFFVFDGEDPLLGSQLLEAATLLPVFKLGRIEKLPIEDFLRQLGREVVPNPLEGAKGAGRQGDLLVDGVTTEVKTLSKGATSATVRNTVNNSVRKGGQAREIVIDARRSGLSRSEAERGIERALGVSRDRVDRITILGDDFFIGGGR